MWRPSLLFISINTVIFLHSAFLRKNMRPDIQRPTHIYFCIITLRQKCFLQKHHAPSFLHLFFAKIFPHFCLVKTAEESQPPSPVFLPKENRINHSLPAGTTGTKGRAKTLQATHHLQRFVRQHPFRLLPPTTGADNSAQPRRTPSTDRRLPCESSCTAF